MLKTSLVFAFVAVAIAQNGTPVCGERQIMAGSGSVKSGVIAFRSVLMPAGTSSNGLGGGGIQVDASANTVHRYMVDEKNDLLFGYDLIVGQKDAAGAHLVTFRPLSQTEQIDLDDVPASLKLMVLPKYPAPQTVHDDETLALDLMISADGTQRLTDYIRILPNQPPEATTNSNPRDFTVDDGPVTFDITQLTFREQGQQYMGASGFTGKLGATLWIAVPGRGRYVLSLVPHESFTKSGTIRDNAVSFTDAGRQYELRFQSPVAGAGKAWNLYVMHDPSYQPEVSRLGLVEMGTDRLDNLMVKH